MGLSDQERHTKVIWSIYHLTQLADEITKEGYWDGKNPYIEIQKLIRKMWPIQLGGKGNNGFWLIGSDEDVSWDNTTLFSTALYSQIKDEGDSLEDMIAEGRKKREQSGEKYLYDCTEVLNMEHLLTGNNAVIYKMKQWLENLQYASNRYEDEVSEQYKALNEIVAQCMGQMFKIWQKEEWAKTWLLSEICKLLVGNTYAVKVKDADIVNQYINKTSAHHDITAGLLMTIPELKEILLLLTEENSIKNRIQALIKIAGKRIGKYKHNAEPLQKMAKEYGVIWKIEKVKKETEKSEYQENKEYYRKALLKTGY